MAVPATHFRFSVTDYHKLVEAGVLTEDSRVELIDGEIIQMSPIGRRHASRVARLTNSFTLMLGAAVIVWPQNPIRLNDYSEPEPDLVLLKPRDDFYEEEIPSASDALLVIEIADSSLDYDRQVKAPLYARNAIPEYWLGDLNQRRLFIYTDPTSDGYASVRVAQLGETVSPLAFPDVQIPVDEIVG
jgi:Uma2 family endonuclease